MKFLPIVLFLIGTLVLLMALMRYSSIKKYNRKYRRRRRPKRVDTLTMLMFPVAAALMLTAVMTLGFGGKAPENQGGQSGQQTQETSEPTTEPESDGWTEKDGKTYYVDENGTPVTGWMDLSGKRYYFGTDGAMTTGWAQVEGVDYYFRNDGSMARGEVKIGDQNYHFDSRGHRVIVANPWNPVPDDYVADFVTLSTEYAVDDCKVDRSCYADLLAMIDACNAAQPRALVVSAYRDFDHQTRNFTRKVNYYLGLGYSKEDAEKEAATEVAVPGTSEHQLGLAVDIIDTRLWDLTSEQANQPAQQWLMENSWQYGFIFRYPKDKIDVTGIIYEPWHYRYVGRELAAEIHYSGLTLEEYIASLG